MLLHVTGQQRGAIYLDTGTGPAARLISWDTCCDCGQATRHVADQFYMTQWTCISSLSALVYTISFRVGYTQPIVNTTSGTLLGSIGDGAILFGSIPYAHPPVGDLRWEPPQPLFSNVHRNATVLGPSCIQQFSPLGSAGADLFKSIYNTPPLPESEDCLLLNVWVPRNISHDGSTRKPVLFWIHGGGFQYGSASSPEYNGENIAANQDIIVVGINYRTNVLGFPTSQELLPNLENLGFLDQDLALQWVQNNIAAFGGDPKEVTIFGESAGAISVGHLLQRHGTNPPFRAAIMNSGAANALPTSPDFAGFDAFAKSLNCTQSPGAARLACLKAVPAAAIKDYLSLPTATSFSHPFFDNITAFSNPIQRIREKKTARIPILHGADQDDGTLFVSGINLTTLLEIFPAPKLVDASQVRAVYPGMTDSQITPLAVRDFMFSCPAGLTAMAYVESGIPNVFRFIYGAVFADSQPIPNAGAWHSSELPEIFGTFNKTSATRDEKALSTTMQTVWSNFAKNPFASPAPGWPKYLPANNTQTLAKLAYRNNVDLGNVVGLAPSGLDDRSCLDLWDTILDP